MDDWGSEINECCGQTDREVRVMGSWEEWAELSPRAGRQAGSLEKPATARVQRSRPLLFLLRIREASQLWLAAPRLRDSQAGGRKGGGEQEVRLSRQLTSQTRYPGSGMVYPERTLFSEESLSGPVKAHGGCCRHGGLSRA